MYKLEFLEGEYAGTVRTITRETILVGRDDDCDIVLQDIDVSRRHATITFTDGQAALHDLGALNPVSLNGTEVRNALLEHMDKLQFGSVVIRFHRVQAVEPIGARRKTNLEWAAVAAIVFLLLAQAVILLGIAPKWRSNVDIVLMNPTPTPTPLPTATPAPTPTPDPNAVEVPAEEPVAEATATPVPLPTQTPTPVPTAVATVAHDLLLPKLDIPDAMESVSTLIGNGRLLDADRMLARIQMQDPGYVPAYAKRGHLYGRRAMYGESVKQWMEVLKLAEESDPVRKTAESEIRVMKRRKRLLDGDLSAFMNSGPAPLATQVPTPEPPPTRSLSIPASDRQGQRIGIEDVKLERYSESRHFDEMRMLTYTLKHQVGEPAAAAGRTRVHVTFYDRNKRSGKIRKSKVESADVYHEVADRLDEGASSVLTAPYVVSRNGRKNGDETFYGVVIRVYYAGRLQELYASPKSLSAYAED